MADEFVYAPLAGQISAYTPLAGREFVYAPLAGQEPTFAAPEAGHGQGGGPGAGRATLSYSDLAYLVSLAGAGEAVGLRIAGDGAAATAAVTATLVTLATNLLTFGPPRLAGRRGAGPGQSAPAAEASRADRAGHDRSRRTGRRQGAVSRLPVSARRELSPRAR